MEIAKDFLNTGINLVLLAPVDSFSFQKSTIVDFFLRSLCGLDMIVLKALQPANR